jgi:hypothetical protein
MRVLPVCIWVLLSVPVVTWAQTAPKPGGDYTDPGPAPQHQPSKPLDLDRLLRPPGTVVTPSIEPSYGGRDRAAWQGQFIDARAEVADLEGKVEAIQNRLRQVTSSDWNYTPSGGEVADPEVLKLRAQLRRDRQSLEASRQRLRDLQVEASLAGVPEEWRGPATGN